MRFRIVSTNLVWPKLVPVAALREVTIAMRIVVILILLLTLALTLQLLLILLMLITIIMSRVTDDIVNVSNNHNGNDINNYIGNDDKVTVIPAVKIILIKIV